MAGLAYRVIDTGSSGGIIVSPLGLQAGARKVADSEEILEVALDPDSTPQEFAMRFLHRLMIGVQDSVALGDEAKAGLCRVCTECGERIHMS